MIKIKKKEGYVNHLYFGACRLMMKRKKKKKKEDEVNKQYFDRWMCMTKKSEGDI